ncbi:nucleotide sugar dehydrogenase [Candidatus Saccharibacteria bacterium]|nr:MAG: nucleotide sugar dehydrogenase [Candidatus Saccharibacteria bacterium]
MTKNDLGSVCVIGLGYVGLPLAVQAAHKGFTVFGIDLNKDIVDKVNSRISPFVNDPGFEHELQSLESGSLKAHTSYGPIVSSDVVIICVPTPTDNNIPDYSYVESTAEEIAKRLKKGHLILLESTINPGVTRDKVLPILESASGLTAGIDFHLAHCPERIDPGNKRFNVKNLNRVVGGISLECSEKAAAFYRKIINAKIIQLDTTEEAEFVKSWENSHRNVMIALANQAAVICDSLGMNIDNVLLGLNSKVEQFGLKLAKPGIGPGGHCIPEDIHYVISRARQSGLDTSLLDGAVRFNDGMPSYAVYKLETMVKSDGKNFKSMKVGILGIAYKENVADPRRSPAIDLVNSLVQKCQKVIIHDPYVDRSYLESIKNVGVSSTLDELLNTCDAFILATAHTVYIDSINKEIIKKSSIKYVLDGRNAFDTEMFRNVDVRYSGIGKNLK